MLLLRRFPSLCASGAVKAPEAQTEDWKTQDRRPEGKWTWWTLWTEWTNWELGTLNRERRALFFAVAGAEGAVGVEIWIFIGIEPDSFFAGGDEIGVQVGVSTPGREMPANEVF